MIVTGRYMSPDTWCMGGCLSWVYPLQVDGWMPLLDVSSPDGWMPLLDGCMPLLDGWMPLLDVSSPDGWMPLLDASSPGYKDTVLIVFSI